MKRLLFSIGVSLISYVMNAQTTTKIEAEAGTLSGGATSYTDNARSGGAYVATGEGSITWSFTTSTAKYYDMYIYVAAPNGDKTNNFVIDANSATFTLASTTTYSLLKVASFAKLAAGTHTIQITKSWGWISVDYLQLVEVDPASRFNTTASLTTPSPTTGTTCLYNFFKSNYGSHIISGVMTLDLLSSTNTTLPLYSQSEVSYLYSQTGKYPALVGFDFMHSTGKGTTEAWFKSYTAATITMATELWNKGGIPSFTWHWKDPTQNDANFYATGANVTSFDLTTAFTNSSCTTWNTSSAAYKGIIADIDVISGLLLQLQNNGVSVIWRPLHEAAGGWFWWGAKGSTACKALYRLMYDRMVNTNGVKNCIWVWTYEPKEDGTWYPGDTYVDIVGRDIYKDGDHTSQIMEFNNINAINNTKMITLSECGSFPSAANLVADGAAWLWFMPWYGDYTKSSTYNTVAGWQEIMTSSYAITLDEMPGWSTYCASNKTPTVSITRPAADTSVNAKSTLTLAATATDADGTIAKVEFYDGTTLLATATASPYTCTISNIVAGTHAITARATDNSGATATSSVVTVTVVPVDCNGTPNGTAFVDDCSACVGGTTGKVSCTASEAEAVAVFDGVTETTNAGYSGSSYVNMTNASTAQFNFALVSSLDQTITVFIRFANGQTSNSTASVAVNGAQQIASTGFPATGGWAIWDTTAVTLILKAGINLVTLTALTTNGGANIDKLWYNLATVTTPKLSKQTIVLDRGWNLISTNVYAADSSIANLFGGVDALEIKNSDVFWRKGQDAYMNGLTSLTSGNGYVVNMISPGTLSILGIAPQSGSIALKPGWNLVGTTLQSNLAISSLFNSTNCQVIKNFEGFWIPSSTINSITDFVPGKGYFMKAANKTTISY